MRSRVRRMIYSKPSAVLLFALLVLFVRGAWEMYEKSVEAREKRDQATSELTTLEEREAALRTEIGRLSNDRGVEEELRQRFMVAKDGENVIIVRSPDTQEGTQTIVVPLDDRSLKEKLMSAVGLGGQ